MSIKSKRYIMIKMATLSYLLKALIITTLLLTAASLNNAKAQDVVTPDDKIYEVVMPANLHILEGKDSLDYYGSGDVLPDDVINLGDAQAIRNGTESGNDRADVNGDGVVNNTDASLIESYVNGTLPYLPAHLSNISMTPEERVAWLEAFQTNVDRTDTVRINNGVTWECAQFSKNFLGNTYGIMNFENYHAYTNYDGTLGHYSNIPTLMVSSRTYNNVLHAYNGMFKGGLSTIDFNNYYFNDSRDKDWLNVQKGDWEMYPGSISLSRFVYCKEDLLGENVFGDVNLISFNMDENYNVTLKGVSPKMMRTNKNAVILSLTAPSDKEYNYEHNLDYGNLGEVSFSTNIQLNSVLNTKSAEGVEDVIGWNYADKSYEFSEPEPLYGDERGQYNYIVRRKGLVDLVEYTLWKSGFWGDTEFRRPIKSDSVYQTITVRDTEAPEISLAVQNVQIESKNFTTPEAAFNYTITDNAEVKSVNYSSVLQESTTLYDKYTVDVNATDVTGNISLGPTGYLTVNKPNAVPEEPEETDCGINKIYPNPVYDEATFVYSSPYPGEEVKFSVYNMSGVKVDEFNQYTNEGENTFNYSFREEAGATPGLYIVKMQSEGCDDMAVVTVE